jgi:hypothetical protein
MPAARRRVKAGIVKFSNDFRNSVLGRGCVLSPTTIQSGQNVHLR